MFNHIATINATLLGQRGIKGKKKDFSLLTRNSIITFQFFEPVRTKGADYEKVADNKSYVLYGKPKVGV